MAIDFLEDSHDFAYLQMIQKRMSDWYSVRVGIESKPVPSLEDPDRFDYRVSMVYVDGVLKLKKHVTNSVLNELLDYGELRLKKLVENPENKSPSFTAEFLLGKSKVVVDFKTENHKFYS